MLLGAGVVGAPAILAIAVLLAGGGKTFPASVYAGVLLAALLVAAGLTAVAALRAGDRIDGSFGRLVDALAGIRDGVCDEPIDVSAVAIPDDVATAFNEMQSAVATREQEIVRIANLDSLTGLPSRDAAVGQIRDLLAARSGVAVISLTLESLDRQAAILGPDAVEQTIAGAAELLRRLSGPEWVIGDAGAGGFILALPDANHDDARDAIDRLRDGLQEGLHVAGTRISPRMRAGIAVSPDDGTDAPTLVICARLDGAQSLPGTTSAGTDPFPRTESFRLAVEFEEALESGAFVMTYQPRIDIGTGTVAGVEAIARWEHPTLGALAPRQFLPVVERLGRTLDLRRHQLREIATRRSDFDATGIDFSLSLDVTAGELIGGGLTQLLQHAAEDDDIVPESLTLQFPEALFADGLAAAGDVLDSLRQAGYRLAIGDFGAVTAPLAALQCAPLDAVRLAPALVSQIAKRRQLALIRATLEVASQAGLAVVANGVETASVLSRLRKLGCEFGQGEHLAPPMTADALLDWLQSGQADKLQPARRRRRAKRRSAGAREALSAATAATQ